MPVSLSNGSTCFKTIKVSYFSFSVVASRGGLREPPPRSSLFVSCTVLRSQWDGEQRWKANLPEDLSLRPWLGRLCNYTYNTVQRTKSSFRHICWWRMELFSPCSRIFPFDLHALYKVQNNPNPSRAVAKPKRAPTLSRLKTLQPHCLAVRYALARKGPAASQPQWVSAPVEEVHWAAPGV